MLDTKKKYPFRDFQTALPISRKIFLAPNSLLNDVDDDVGVVHPITA
jgi:hypothetical protein